MGDAFECDRCGDLQRGKGHRRSKYIENDDGTHDMVRQDFCDRCNEIIERLIAGELTIDDFRLHGGCKRP